MVRLKRSQIGVFISLAPNKNLKTAVAVNISLDAMKLVQVPIPFIQSSKLALAKVSV
jgi:hypothetical protein